MGLGSLGNDNSNTSAIKPLLASLFLILIVVLPDIQEVRYLEPKATIKYLVSVSLILCSLAISLHWIHALYLLLPSQSAWKAKIKKHVLQSEVDLKSSAAFKMDRLVNNAVEIHHSKDEQRVLKTCFGHALNVFSKWNKTERVGGVVWVWRRIWNGDLARREGITFSVRLIAANVSQYAVVLFIFMAFVYARKTVAENYDKTSVREIMHEYVDYVIPRLARCGAHIGFCWCIHWILPTDTAAASGFV